MKFLVMTFFHQHWSHGHNDVMISSLWSVELCFFDNLSLSNISQMLRHKIINTSIIILAQQEGSIKLFTESQSLRKRMLIINASNLDILFVGFRKYNRCTYQFKFSFGKRGNGEKRLMSLRNLKRQVYCIRTRRKCIKNVYSNTVRKYQMLIQMPRRV